MNDEPNPANRRPVPAVNGRVMQIAPMANTPMGQYPECEQSQNGDNISRRPERPTRPIRQYRGLARVKSVRAVTERHASVVSTGKPRRDANREGDSGTVNAGLRARVRCTMHSQMNTTADESQPMTEYDYTRVNETDPSDRLMKDTSEAWWSVMTCVESTIVRMTETADNS